HDRASGAPPRLCSPSACQSAENLSEMLPQLTAQRLSAVRVRGGSRAGSFVDGRLPEMSNFYCHPGRAGGPPLVGYCCDSNACFARAALSRIWPADLVQMNGLGSALWFSRYSMIALLSSATLLKMPRRIRFRVISAKNRSTMLSQDAEVGVKCKWKRGWALSQ